MLGQTTLLRGNRQRRYLKATLRRRNGKEKSANYRKISFGLPFFSDTPRQSSAENRTQEE
jgi:hypothetical protein